MRTDTTEQVLPDRRTDRRIVPGIFGYVDKLIIIAVVMWDGLTHICAALRAGMDRQSIDRGRRLPYYDRLGLVVAVRVNTGVQLDCHRYIGACFDFQSAPAVTIGMKDQKSVAFLDGIRPGAGGVVEPDCVAGRGSPPDGKKNGLSCLKLEFVQRLAGFPILDGQLLHGGRVKGNIEV